MKQDSFRTDQTSVLGQTPNAMKMPTQLRVETPSPKSALKKRPVQLKINVGSMPASST